MTYIEKYKEQQALTNKIIANFNKARGLTAIGEKDPKNDKHQIDFYDHKIWNGDIQVWFHASYGYYGDSSGYSACCPEMQQYLIKALNHYKGEIVNYMIEQVEKDKNDALLACKQEAESILKQIEENTLQ